MYFMRFIRFGILINLYNRDSATFIMFATKSAQVLRMISPVGTYHYSDLDALSRYVSGVRQGVPPESESQSVSSRSDSPVAAYLRAHYRHSGSSGADLISPSGSPYQPYSGSGAPAVPFPSSSGTFASQDQNNNEQPAMMHHPFAADSGNSRPPPHYSQLQHRLEVKLPSKISVLT